MRLVLEDRVQILGSSPHAVTWDNGGDRLLYHRGEWHYQVIAGTEDPYGPVRLKTFICELPAAEMPLTDLAQGSPFALVEDLVLAPEDPETLGYYGPRQVEVIAADPTSGAFGVYSHREDLFAPYRTDVHTFSPIGAPIGHVEVPQPDDGTPRWHVPHALVYDGNLYALERDTTHWPDVGPATGRLVRRGLGPGVGAGSAIWSTGNRFRFPHTVALDPDAEPRLWVFWNQLYEPGTFLSYLRSYVTELTVGSGEIASWEINFGYTEDPDLTTRTYVLGGWEAAGGPNTGGVAVFDGYAGLGPRFLATGISPEGFSQDTLDPVSSATFRFTSNAHIADVGGALPIPISRKGAAGLLGAWSGYLPESLEAP